MKSFFWQVKEIIAMVLGNYQCMTVMDGIDIENGKYLFILKQHFCWNFTGDDIAENAIRLCTHTRKIYPNIRGKSKGARGEKILFRKAFYGIFI